MVQSREPIPADMILVGVSEKLATAPQGAAYVETKSLDGETNLKMRNALPSTYKLVIHPNNAVDYINAYIDVYIFLNSLRIERLSLEF
jgi:magnesium-transporting ATPase (P-type)